MKILIYGSCVTNDIFSSVKNNHKIAAYIPRLSMAAAFGKAAPDFIIEAAKKNIGSLTHRYWVLNDLEKRMGKILSSTSYDIIILDFVDEKNNLGLIDGSVITMTDEFKKTNIYESMLEIVPSMSEKHYELWKVGLDIFSKHVDQKKVFLNKVYLAQRSNDGAQFSIKFVIENNIFLEKLYTHVEENYNFNVIDYDRSIFIGDKNHKHGKAPYHFIYDYYQHAMSSIDGIESNDVINEWRQKIPASCWLSSVNSINTVGKHSYDTIRFFCNTIDCYGYIQTFGKSFEKILPNEAGSVPFGAKSAELSLILHVMSSDLDVSNAYAGLFFMGYDADGVRIANVQQRFYLRDRTVPLNSFFNFGENVRFFKIALRISNLQGLVELHPGAINFSAEVS